MSTNLDYSKFDKLADQLDEEEKRDEFIHKLQLRQKYEKEQREKQIEWEDEMRRQGKDVEKLKKQMQGGCGHSHFGQGHGHDHSDDRSHNEHNHDDHDHSNCDHDDQQQHQSVESQAPKTEQPQQPKQQQQTPFAKHSCGYMPIEEIKRLQKEAESKPKISNADKNIKKREAVFAAKLDGNRIFKEGNYKLAYQIYERGVLIINGMYGMTDEKYEEMENIECLLNLNMALCQLKLKEWTEAIEGVRMAIQIDASYPKAYFRWAEALIGMGEYEEARKQNIKAKDKNDKKLPKNATAEDKEMIEYNKNEKSISTQLKRINMLHKKQIAKQRKDDREMAKHIQSKLKKEALSKDMKPSKDEQVSNSNSEESGFEIDDENDAVDRFED